MGSSLSWALALACAPVAWAHAAESQTPEPQKDGQSLEDLLTVSQDDLLSMDTGVTAQAASQREAPGVLTVVSRDEILATGARDLADVLHQVAGFALAQDVENVTDAGFRGVWGHEGKILLMIDGQELNEPLYATLQLGHHYLLRNVDRIEIIRGPGSVIYGGNAELAVINVVSRTAKQIGTFDIEGTYGNFTSDHGRFVDNYARRSLQGAFGYIHEPTGLELTGSLAWGQGNRSPRQFHDLNQSPTYAGTQGNANIDPLFLNLGLTIGDFRLRFLLDHYDMSDRYPFDALVPTPLDLSFSSYILDAQYTIKPHAKVTIVPRLTVKEILPWHNALATPYGWNNDYYNKQVLRSTANVTATWEVIDGLTLLAGVQGTLDYASQTLPPDDYRTLTETAFANGKNYITYEDFAFFVQGVWMNPWVNITAGGRVERHSAYGASVVPRIAVTKAIDGFHFKALFSEAFRAPAIENIHLSPKIRPEYTYALELELGYAISKAFYVGVNVFDITIKDPIVYDSAGANEDYFNYPRTGTIGAEIELRYRGAYGFATLSYSFSSEAGMNQVPQYTVPQRNDTVLGLPMHKAVGTAGLNLGEHWVLGPSLTVLGPRYGTLNTAGVVHETSTTFLANFVVTYRDFFLRNLDVSLGAYNFLDQPFTYIQAYNSYTADVSNGRAPIPGLDREVTLRAAWTFE